MTWCYVLFTCSYSRKTWRFLSFLRLGWLASLCRKTWKQLILEIHFLGRDPRPHVELLSFWTWQGTPPPIPEQFYLNYKKSPWGHLLPFTSFIICFTCFILLNSSFVNCPDSASPSLWEQFQLTGASNSTCLKTCGALFQPNSQFQHNMILNIFFSLSGVGLLKLWGLSFTCNFSLDASKSGWGGWRRDYF